jgi:hypothetical protein
MFWLFIMSRQQDDISDRWDVQRFATDLAALLPSYGNIVAVNLFL